MASHRLLLHDYCLTINIALWGSKNKTRYSIKFTIYYSSVIVEKGNLKQRPWGRVHYFIFTDTCESHSAGPLWVLIHTFLQPMKISCHRFALVSALRMCSRKYITRKVFLRVTLRLPPLWPDKATCVSVKTYHMTLLAFFLAK